MDGEISPSRSTSSWSASILVLCAGLFAGSGAAWVAFQPQPKAQISASRPENTAVVVPALAAALVPKVKIPLPEPSTPGGVLLEEAKAIEDFDSRFTSPFRVDDLNRLQAEVGTQMTMGAAVDGLLKPEAADIASTTKELVKLPEPWKAMGSLSSAIWANVQPSEAFDWAVANGDPYTLNFTAATFWMLSKAKAVESFKRLSSDQLGGVIEKLVFSRNVPMNGERWMLLDTLKTRKFSRDHHGPNDAAAYEMIFLKINAESEPQKVEEYLNARQDEALSDSVLPEVAISYAHNDWPAACKWLLKRKKGDAGPAVEELWEKWVAADPDSFEKAMKKASWEEQDGMALAVKRYQQGLEMDQQFRQRGHPKGE